MAVSHAKPGQPPRDPALFLGETAPVLRYLGWKFGSARVFVEPSAEDEGEGVLQWSENGLLARMSVNHLRALSNPHEITRDEFEWHAPARFSDRATMAPRGAVVELPGRPGVPWYTTGRGWSRGGWVNWELCNLAGELCETKPRACGVYTGPMPVAFLDLLRHGWRAPGVRA